MPAPIKGIEKLIKQIRESSDTGTYKVSFDVREDGLIHDFKMELAPFKPDFNNDWDR